MEIDIMDLGSMDITQVQVKDSDKMGYLVDLEETSMSSNEFHRLKQEMNQSMNMYNTACKEAVSAQQRATELQQLKLGEMSRIEQALLNEEAAVTLVEMEKAKCRAAIVAANHHSRPPMGFTHHVERAIEKWTFADLLDPTVSNWPIEEALIYAKLALKCAELRRKDNLILVQW